MKTLAAVAAALMLAGSAAASEQRPTLEDLADELVCPVCAPQTLDQSDAPAAEQMKRFIRRRIAAGDTKSEIKAQLVADFGEQVLASPPREGFNLLAWVLPLAGAGAAAAVLGVLAWRWSRARQTPAPAIPASGSLNGRPLDPELERRLDDELARFDA